MRPTLRPAFCLALTASLTVFCTCVLTLAFSAPAMAVEIARPTPQSHEYRGLKGLFLSPRALPLTVEQKRSEVTKPHRIMRHAPINHVTQGAKSITLCHNTHPHHHTSWAKQAGRAARFAMNDSHKDIEEIIIQPHFGGLHGRALSVMRRDIERHIIDNKGSTQEIFHNARSLWRTNPPCFHGLKTEFDLELRHQIDVRQSHQALLYRSDAIINLRAHMGSYLTISAGITTPITHNLGKDDNLLTLNTHAPIRQDIAAQAYQGLNIDHLMLSRFFTPKTDLYAAIHGGYIEEGFAGIGGELLYRPYSSPFAIGFDAWRTIKRTSYINNMFELDTANKQFSAFINAWYDIPKTPVTIGLSAGRFLAGDIGAEISAAYKPAPGWSLKGFARYSGDRETAPIARGKGTHYTFGIRASMPMGQIATIPENSIQTIDFKPFGYDKRQRIHNRYALHDLTDPWSSAQLYRYWNRLTQ